MRKRERGRERYWLAMEREDGWLETEINWLAREEEKKNRLAMRER